MEKLTLENIACYGEGLYFTKSDWKSHLEIGYYAILKPNQISVSDVLRLQAGLILRPMSDLTKPIIIEGKEVTPIVELAKIAFPALDWRFDEVNLTAITTIKKIRLSFSFHGDFMTLQDKPEQYEVWHTNNQLQLFQWLFKHKFDVFGLISKSLAIDVNTLETNPYNN